MCILHCLRATSDDQSNSVLQARIMYDVTQGPFPPGINLTLLWLPKKGRLFCPTKVGYNVPQIWQMFVRNWLSGDLTPDYRGDIAGLKRHSEEADTFHHRTSEWKGYHVGKRTHVTHAKTNGWKVPPFIMWPRKRGWRWAMAGGFITLGIKAIQRPM